MILISFKIKHWEIIGALPPLVGFQNSVSMAMRDLVSGGAACAVPGSSSSSNPLGALANALIGSSSKTQVVQLFPLFLVNSVCPFPSAQCLSFRYYGFYIYFTDGVLRSY